MENMVVTTPTMIVMLGLSVELGGGGSDLGGGGSGDEVVMEGVVDTRKIINGVGCHGDLKPITLLCLQSGGEKYMVYCRLCSSVGGAIASEKNIQ